MADSSIRSIENAKHCLESAMPASRPLVAYIFTWVRKKPRSVSELNQAAWAKRQKVATLKFARSHHLSISKTLVGVTTYRKKAFVHTQEFQDAVRLAGERDADLVLADIAELLARGPSDRVAECIEALDKIEVEIWDATHGRLWRSFTELQRVHLTLLASQVHTSRSNAIRAGLKLSKGVKESPPRENGRRGNASARRDADAFAKRHAGFVKSEQAKLAIGKKLSPTSLARALNDADIPSRRGGRWSHNAAKDLMQRQEALGMLRD
jgi:hypothetical protein